VTGTISPLGVRVVPDESTVLGLGGAGMLTTVCAINAASRALITNTTIANCIIRFIAHLKILLTILTILGLVWCIEHVLGDDAQETCFKKRLDGYLP
jgi:hypothetical protein